MVMYSQEYCEGKREESSRPTDLPTRWMLTAAADLGNTGLFCFFAILAAVLVFTSDHAVTSRMTTLFLLRHTVTCLPSFLPCSILWSSR